MGITFVVHGNIVLADNSSLFFGEALYISQREEGPIFNGVLFSNNIAKAGSAVFFSAIIVTYGSGAYESSDGDEDAYCYLGRFVSCRFEGNSASSTGGAIYSSTAGKDMVWKKAFINNSADFWGALQIFGTDSESAQFLFCRP